MGKASQHKGPALRRAVRRAPSEKQTQGHHAARQGFREQSELDARLMAEDEDLDLWEPETSLEGDDTLESLGFDSDVDMTDEDDVPTGDAAERILPPASFAEANLLIVHEGRAISQPPDWNLGLRPSAWAEERSLRFAMLGRVAAWFTEKRTAFLRSPVSPGCPDPLLNFSLGKTDLTGPIPVLEEGLLTATGCDAVGDYSTFNRHLRHAVLKWPDYHLPVADLLSHQGRIAWVAAAILDLRQERSINPDLLRGKLTVPKGKDSDAARAILRRIPAANPRKAAPKDYAIAACLKVQVAWDKVVQKYEELIFNP